MFISQEKAKEILRKRAGYSIAKAAETVKAMPKTRDGKRLKIRLSDVEGIVREANKPTIAPIQTRTTRPFRKELREQALGRN